MFHAWKFLSRSFGAVLACSAQELQWERAVLGVSRVRVKQGTRPPLQGLSSSWGSCCSCLCRRKKVFLPCLSEPAPARRGEEKEPVPGDGGITSTASLWLCEQNSLSEPCRSSLRSIVRDGVPQNSKIKSREQVWWFFPSSSHLSWMWGSCQLEDLKKTGKEKMTQNSVAVTIFYPKMCRTRQSSEVIQWRLEFFYFWRGTQVFNTSIWVFRLNLCFLSEYSPLTGSRGATATWLGGAFAAARFSAKNPWSYHL